jgi:hypothetical protein
MGELGSREDLRFQSSDFKFQSFDLKAVLTWDFSLHPCDSVFIRGGFCVPGGLEPRMNTDWHGWERCWFLVGVFGAWWSVMFWVALGLGWLVLGE